MTKVGFATVPDSVLDAYRGRKILITGANGFIGGAVTQILSGIDCDLFRVARSKLSPVSGSARVTDIITDLRSIGSWKGNLTPVDIVFHFAAQTSVYSALDDPAIDLETNVGGLLNLFALLRRQKSLPHVVIAGTVTQGGISPSLPVDENAEDNPLTFYDLSKLTAEKYLEMHVQYSLVTGTCLRLPNVYGMGAGALIGDRGILDTAITRAVAGESLYVYGDGDWLRDYTFIDDVVTAFLYAGALPTEVSGRHFIIGTGVGTPLKTAFQTAIAIAEAQTGYRSALESRAPPAHLSPIEFRNFSANSGAFQKATGWRPQVPLKKGIELTVEAILQRREKN